MKIDRKCPKCSSEKISKVKHSHPSNITIGVVGKARVSKYICIECGFIEDWIEYEPDLTRIERHYGKDW